MCRGQDRTLMANHRSRVAHTLWVAESARPFHLVSDRGYLELMKTGRPSVYVPSATTLSRDVRLNFERAQKRIKGALKVSRVHNPESKNRRCLCRWCS